MAILLLLLTGIIGACATFYVNVKLNQGPVRSSAGLTLLVAGVLYLFPDVLPLYLTQHIPVVFIGASFIGMVSAQQMSTYMGISIAGLIFTSIYLNTSHFFTGYGGALGTSACISLLVVLAIPHFKSKRKLTVGLLQLRRLAFKRKTKRNQDNPN
ncbi:hypothetical protein ACL9RF_14150 [Sphingobacterium sp. Mn56C]|uniref:hypothetical protein n=1 Tax=Sphingobacterium sp. Mn56C TaxID=3395261 RepID=UPI003BCF92CF